MRSSEAGGVDLYAVGEVETLWEVEELFWLGTFDCDSCKGSALVGS